ncbi:hypothetical protein [Erythrobacter sp. JK5]|uniref:hypothetical protein n=1 Tax=Erythrobacter sp. JK5 TaxID=2829500 RepID=UPI001BACBEEE|nr:hypothetical protein [Erythrobacter sp. JK5]QUL36752.1 hypothetical protein KDC96_10015 [Erythrobacter sp. JK5]
MIAGALRLLGLALGAGLLTGCAFAPQLQRVAIDQNQMVAEVEDELTLLNIVRASHRFPLHFTAVSEVNGNVEVSGSVGIDAALKSGTDTFEPGAGLSARTAPNFRASVLATETFQRGIQQPITAQTVAYYLDAGWPDQLIMALFIERVDVYRRGEPERVAFSVSNEPEQTARFGALLCNFELAARPTVSSRPLADFSDLIDLQKLQDNDTDSETRRTEISAFLELIGREGVSLSGDTLFLTGSSNSVMVQKLKEPRCNDTATPLLDAEGVVIVPRFRSTQGVIYFLGEYVRTARRGSQYLLPFANTDCDSVGGPVRQFRPIMTVDRGTGRALVATRFGGERYFIPAEESASCEDGAVVGSRTMQVVAIVQQLLNLHKSSDLLPASISVTGIN